MTTASEAVRAGDHGHQRAATVTCGQPAAQVSALTAAAEHDEEWNLTNHRLLQSMPHVPQVGRVGGAGCWPDLALR